MKKRSHVQTLNKTAASEKQEISNATNKKHKTSLTPESETVSSSVQIQTSIPQAPAIPAPPNQYRATFAHNQWVKSFFTRKRKVDDNFSSNFKCAWCELNGEYDIQKHYNGITPPLYCSYSCYRLDFRKQKYNYLKRKADAVLLSQPMVVVDKNVKMETQSPELKEEQDDEEKDEVKEEIKQQVSVVCCPTSTTSHSNITKHVGYHETGGMMATPGFAFQKPVVNIDIETMDKCDEVKSIISEKTNVLNSTFATSKPLDISFFYTPLPEEQKHVCCWWDTCEIGCNSPPVALPTYIGTKMQYNVPVHDNAGLQLEVSTVNFIGVFCSWECVLSYDNLHFEGRHRDLIRLLRKRIQGIPMSFPLLQAPLPCVLSKFGGKIDLSTFRNWSKEIQTIGEVDVQVKGIVGSLWKLNSILMDLQPSHIEAMQLFDRKTDSLKLPARPPKNIEHAYWEMFKKKSNDDNNIFQKQHGNAKTTTSTTTIVDEIPTLTTKPPQGPIRAHGQQKQYYQQQQHSTSTQAHHKWNTIGSSAVTIAQQNKKAQYFSSFQNVQQPSESNQKRRNPQQLPPQNDSSINFGNNNDNNNHSNPNEKEPVRLPPVFALPRQRVRAIKHHMHNKQYNNSGNKT